MSKTRLKEFHILSKIAEGGFGAVYLTKLVHSDGFSRLVALKLLHGKWSKNEEVASRMRDEARLLGWLRHRNIVDVMDLTRIDGRVAVVMEYLEAVDCGTIIKNCSVEGASVPIRSVLEIGSFIASALDAAFNQAPYSGEKPLRVIHRDIKPSNIMIDVHGSVKVLDFGVARADFEQRESATQEMSFGSFDYMSSERIFLEAAGPRSDVYSLGSMCFELLMSERFGRVRIKKQEHDEFVMERLEVMKTTLDLPASIRDELLHLFERMLAFEESERPDSIDVYKEMKALARRLSEGALEDWAEAILPPIVELFQSRTDDGLDPLVGQCLLEDPLEDVQPADVSSNSAEESAPLSTTAWVHQHEIAAASPPERHEQTPLAIRIPDPFEDPEAWEEKESRLMLPLFVFGLNLVFLFLGVIALLVALLLPGGFF